MSWTRRVAAPSPSGRSRSSSFDSDGRPSVLSDSTSDERAMALRLQAHAHAFDAAHPSTPGSDEIAPAHRTMTATAPTPVQQTGHGHLPATVYTVREIDGSVWSTPFSRRKRICMQAVMCFLGFSFMGSIAMYPPLFTHFQAEFELEPHHLALIAAVRSGVRFGTLPFWGALSDRARRKRQLIAGCCVWVLALTMVAVSSSFGLLMCAATLHGLALGIVYPVFNSITSDIHPPHLIGRVSGLMEALGALGALATVFIASIVGGIDGMMLSGWRVVAIAMTILPLVGLILCATLLPPVIPRHSRAVFRRVDIARILKTRSVIFLILQGVFGTIAWEAVQFVLLYLQTLGISTILAAVVVGATALGMAIGTVIGGAIGDRAERCSRRYGRIAVTQVSMAFAVGFAVVCFYVLPGITPLPYWGLVASGFVFGMLMMWNVPACNFPVITTTVPSHRRSTAFAIDQMIEGAVGSVGPLLVGFLTESFGYDSSYANVDVSQWPEDVRIAAAHAFRKALSLVTAVPFAVCLLFYSGLYRFYWRERLSANQEAGVTVVDTSRKPGDVETGSLEPGTDALAGSHSAAPSSREHDVELVPLSRAMDVGDDDDDDDDDDGDDGNEGAGAGDEASPSSGPPARAVA